MRQQWLQERIWHDNNAGSGWFYHPDIAILSSMRAHHIIVLITGRQLLQKSYREIIFTGEILLSFRQRIQESMDHYNNVQSHYQQKMQHEYVHVLFQHAGTCFIAKIERTSSPTNLPNPPSPLHVSTEFRAIWWIFILDSARSKKKSKVTFSQLD